MTTIVSAVADRLVAEVEARASAGWLARTDRALLRSWAAAEARRRLLRGSDAQGVVVDRFLSDATRASQRLAVRLGLPGDVLAAFDEEVSGGG